MAVISDRLKLAYFDITKAGSSSVKLALWELEHGRPFEGRGASRFAIALRARLARRRLVAPRNIHDAPGYRNQRFDLARVPEGFATFTLLRDPARRLHSAWRDKIHRAQFAWRGEEMDLESEGLPLDPGFGDFIDNFPAYRMVSRAVRVHTTPYRWHLGDDMGFFDHVFRIEDFAALEAFLAARAGHPVRLPHENSSAARARDARLSRRQLDRLFEILAPDYQLLGGLYDMTAARARLAG